MAERTRQANFRLSESHVDIINKLANLGLMKKASVIERALDLLQQNVNAGGHIPATPPASKTKQANFRISIHHVDLINSLAAREHVSKATVVERALELLDEEMTGKPFEPAADELSSHQASDVSVVPANAMMGNRAVDLSVLEDEETDYHNTLKLVPSQAPKLAAKVDPKRVPLVEPEPVAVHEHVAKVDPRRVPLVEPEVTSVPAPVPVSEATAILGSDPEPTIGESRDKVDPAPRSRRRTHRAKADKGLISEPINEPAHMAQPAQAKHYGGFQSAPTMPEQVRPAAVYPQQYTPVPTMAMPQAHQVDTSADMRARAAELKAQNAITEAKLTAQIEALKQTLEAKDARIDALSKQVDDRHADARDARMESLMEQIVENGKRSQTSYVAGPSQVSAPPTASAPERISPQPQTDPRIDSILRQLEEQRQNDKDAKSEARIESLISRLESTMREMQAPTRVQQTPTASSSDELLKTIQAISALNNQNSSAANSELLFKQISEAREAGREEGRRQALGEMNKVVEAARSAGYEAGLRQGQLEAERAVDEARTEGAFRERAKIANMRGWVFGEKRRYLKVHVTL